MNQTVSNRPLLVSACLTGLPARYDGLAKTNTQLLRLLEGRAWLPVCPEQLGGLATPRPACTIVGRTAEADGRAVLAGRARVVDLTGQDRTGEFLRGAEAVLDLARRTGAGTALLKSLSPSCGPVKRTGSDGRLRPMGVTAALLQEAGLQVLEVDQEGVSQEVRRLLS
ncbi:MAG: DUF523 domain-containing protein [Deltaproteobacteria bacterium]|nr:DUF523 domain-containing protein [Deltaproteobacteria bacterium]